MSNIKFTKSRYYSFLFTAKIIPFNWGGGGYPCVNPNDGLGFKVNTFLCETAHWFYYTRWVQEYDGLSIQKRYLSAWFFFVLFCSLYRCRAKFTIILVPEADIDYPSLKLWEQQPDKDLNLFVCLFKYKYLYKYK